MPEKKFANLPYLPHTDSEREEMLQAIGVRTFEELVSHVPAEIRAKKLEVADGLSELELSEHVASMAAKNVPASRQASFLGGGSYRRFVPSIVPAITSRSEFATAYTPYQPEMSQGNLQAIYEFQTAICLLTAMEVANASMYDGPTACGEAALMSARLNNRSLVAVSDAVNPEYAEVTKTYVQSCGLTFNTFQTTNGVTDAGKLPITEETACVIVQYPNFWGALEDLAALEKAVHARGAILVVVTDPISLALLKPPGEFGADIVVGDAQSCGNFLSYGGPSAGYMATRKDFVRQLPGRLCGMTVDNRGQRAFTLTLQTREQHIRRAKATSNICTNQALNALCMLVYIAALGPQGMKQIASVSVQRAHYLATGLCAIPGVSLYFNAPYFNEFTIKTTRPSADVLAQLEEYGILGGIDLSNLGSDHAKLENAILVAVTETNSPAELDHYIASMAKVIAGDAAKSSQGEREAVSTAKREKART